MADLDMTTPTTANSALCLVSSVADFDVTLSKGHSYKILAAGTVYFTTDGNPVQSAVSKLGGGVIPAGEAVEITQVSQLLMKSNTGTNAVSVTRITPE